MQFYVISVVKSLCTLHNNEARGRREGGNTDEYAVGGIELRTYTKTNSCFVIFSLVPPS